MIWRSLGFNDSDIISAAGAALAMFLLMRRAFAREPFSHAQLGRVLLAAVGVLLGFVVLGLALDALFGTARLPVALPGVVLKVVAQILGLLAARFLFPPRPSGEPHRARIHVRLRKES